MLHLLFDLSSLANLRRTHFITGGFRVLSNTKAAECIHNAVQASYRTGATDTLRSDSVQTHLFVQRKLGVTFPCSFEPPVFVGEDYILTKSTMPIVKRDTPTDCWFQFKVYRVELLCTQSLESGEDD